MSQRKKIAYLAPEIPGFSSTFVYNEIFALMESDFTVETFSVHRAGNFEDDSKLKPLAQRTCYLYEAGIVNVFIANIAVLLIRPHIYLKVLLICLGDMFKTITQPKIAIGLFYRFLMSAVLARGLRKSQVAHLHIHFAHVPTDIGMYASMLAGISYSVTAHANDIFERGWLLKEKVHRSKFFATISNFNVDWLVRLGADKSKLKVVRCGVDSEQFNLRQRKTKSSPVVFGFLGRLVEKKGADILIEACASIAEKHIEFIVEIVGNGPLEDHLKSKVSKLNLNEKVNFLGPKPHSEISGWLESLDYFVLPCVKDSQGDMDGIPVALMEAMLKGVPVISTDISGIPELVIGDDTGLSAKNNDVESLSAILLKASGEQDDEVSMRISNAESLVRSEYDLKANAKKLGEAILC
jgi:glycosyltransferase involved in cell wall biosynthesis